MVPVGGSVSATELETILPNLLRNRLPLYQVMQFLANTHGIHFTPIRGAVHSNRTSEIAALLRVPEQIMDWQGMILSKVSQKGADQAAAALAYDTGASTQAPAPAEAEDQAEPETAGPPVHQDVPVTNAIMVELVVALVRAWVPILQGRGLL